MILILNSIRVKLLVGDLVFEGKNNNINKVIYKSKINRVKL